MAVVVRCDAIVRWWDLDMVARCKRREKHDGWHWDGLRFWDEHGLQKPGSIETGLPLPANGWYSGYDHVQGRYPGQ